MSCAERQVNIVIKANSVCKKIKGKKVKKKGRMTMKQHPKAIKCGLEAASMV